MCIDVFINASVRIGLDLQAGCADACWLGPRLVVSASDTGAVEIWDWKGVGTFASVSEFHEHEDMVRAVDVNIERSQCLSASQDGSVKLWDASASQGSSIATLSGHTSAVFQARFGKTTETQQLVASVSRDCTLRVWDTRQLPGAGQSVVGLGTFGTSVAWVPTASGSKIVAGHVDGSVRVFDPRNLQDSMATLTNQTGVSTHLCARVLAWRYARGDDVQQRTWLFSRDEILLLRVVRVTWVMCFAYGTF